MTYELIEKFVEPDPRRSQPVNIHFRNRATVTGIIIAAHDYLDMKKKNFWRIVPASRINEWQQSKDTSLSRLFNGMEFSRLTLAKGSS